MSFKLKKILSIQLVIWLDVKYIQETSAMIDTQYEMDLT